MNYAFKTADWKDGEEAFFQSFVTDEGGTITLHMGRVGMLGIAGVVLRMMREDPNFSMEAQLTAATIKVDKEDIPCEE